MQLNGQAGNEERTQGAWSAKKCGAAGRHRQCSTPKIRTNMHFTISCGVEQRRAPQARRRVEFGVGIRLRWLQAAPAATASRMCTCVHLIANVHAAKAADTAPQCDEQGSPLAGVSWAGLAPSSGQNRHGSSCARLPGLRRGGRGRDGGVWARYARRVPAAAVRWPSAPAR